jgi:Rrf2 family protein
MVHVPNRSRYALRALFDLALNYGTGPVRATDIADRQAIPVRFLATILVQLKQAGLAHSVRGAHGGYTLARGPADVSVGELMRALHSSEDVLACSIEDTGEICALRDHCVFMPLWRQAQDAVLAVYDGTTFADLVQAYDEMRLSAPNYVI